MNRPISALFCLGLLATAAGCYKPYVSPEAVVRVSEINEKDVTPDLVFMGTVEVSVPGDARYTELGVTNGRGAVREAAYKKGATHFAIVVVKQGFMTTDVIAKIYQKKPA